MALAQWPSTLPEKPFLEGNTESFANGRLPARTDTGPGKMRRRTSAATRPLAGHYVLTLDQLQVFRHFHDTTIKGGSLPFVIVDPWLHNKFIGRTSDKATLTRLNGGRLMISAHLIVRFAEPPTIETVGMRYRVFVNLAVLP